MAKTRVGINGFGRIGRNFFRAHLERGGDFELVAINDLGDAKTMGHLLKYDSVLGQLDEDVEVGDGVITAGKTELKVLSEKDPAGLPWRDLEVELVIESTGFFTDRDGAQKHIDAGAKKVVISAPATDPDVTIVLGVNDDQYDPEQHHIVSNASCTTNCVAPLAKVLHDKFTVEGLRRYAAHPLVSTDIVHSQYSCIVDSELTMANGTMAKVFGWYDNEWGYSCRLVDVVSKIAADIPASVAA